MTLKEYILGEMDDVRATLLVAIDGLSEEDLTSMEPCGHWPVAWIAMHLAAAMDSFVNFELTGKFAMEHDPRVAKFPFPDPQPGDEYPPLETLVANWNIVMDKVEENIAGLDDEAFDKCGGHLPFENWNHPFGLVVMWMVKHHHQHLRMLWTILGERRVDGKWDEKWNSSRKDD